MSLEQWSQIASILSFITSVISIILVFVIKDKITRIDNKVEINKQKNDTAVIEKQYNYFGSVEKKSSEIIKNNIK